ncbi:MAG: enoyl-CoA hydratase/isomerase family protein [Deltaproteobacteria bacterium]|nr:enoyl-CoA hydratase/isomerase family protein [Candidatus Zymogenaceae bacterium]
MTGSIAVDRDGAVSVVTLSRPEDYNSFDETMMRELGEVLSDAAADDAVRGVVLTGAGRAFCAGGDLKYINGHERGPEGAFRLVAGAFHRAIMEIHGMKKPVVAAINGPAAGGGFSLAMAADFRVMGTSAVLKLGYLSAGLCIDGGGTHTLPRLVGIARAMEIAAFDEPIDAEKARDLGLVTTIVDDTRVVAEAVALARRVGSGPLFAFGAVKGLIYDAFDVPFEIQLERERDMIARSGAHPEGREGMAAFIEKRKPKFS